MKNLLLLFLFVTMSCQNTNDKMNKAPITDSNPTTITAGNALSVQQKQIKHYKKEPLYYIYIDHEQCFFDILVNDIPAFQYFKDGGIMSQVTLNNYIAKSGKQKITYRLYPQTKREYGEGFKELTPYTRFKLTLYSRDNADSLTSFDKRVQVFEHTNLKKEDGKTFIGAGLPYYEYTVEFNATVPYEQSPTLETAVDLKSMDKELLEKKTVEAYNFFRKIISEKNKDQYFSLVFNSDCRQIKSEYYTDEYLKETGNEDLFYFETPSFKLEPLENYTMKIYGDGKLVGLEHASKDIRLQGKSSIWGKYNAKEGGVRVRFLKILLYIPKGKDTFEIW
ncbi:hypothetical protein [Chryseobacterium phosphatilyticum]|nr:hypothetical protein [Chryseobacterium phosphatilyticum]